MQFLKSTASQISGVCCRSLQKQLLLVCDLAAQAESAQFFFAPIWVFFWIFQVKTVVNIAWASLQDDVLGLGFGSVFSPSPFSRRCFRTPTFFLFIMYLPDCGGFNISARCLHTIRAQKTHWSSQNSTKAHQNWVESRILDWVYLGHVAFSWAHDVSEFIISWTQVVSPLRAIGLLLLALHLRKLFVRKDRLHLPRQVLRYIYI